MADTLKKSTHLVRIAQGFWRGCTEQHGLQAKWPKINQELKRSRGSKGFAGVWILYGILQRNTLVDSIFSFFGPHLRPVLLIDSFSLRAFHLVRQRAPVSQLLRLLVRVIIRESGPRDDKPFVGLVASSLLQSSILRHYLQIVRFQLLHSILIVLLCSRNMFSGVPSYMSMTICCEVPSGKRVMSSLSNSWFLACGSDSEHSPTFYVKTLELATQRTQFPSSSQTPYSLLKTHFAAFF